MSTPAITVIGNTAIDLIYSAEQIQKIADKTDGKVSVQSFLNALPELLGHDENGKQALPEAPRPGDAILSPDEILDNAMHRFLEENGIALADTFNTTDSSPILHLAGTPQMAPGGAIANTASTIAHANLAKMQFLSVSDARQRERDVFASSLPPGVVIHEPVHGKALEVHVFPIDGDRVQIASPSLNNAADHHDLSPHIPETITANTDIVMLEGFMAFGPHYDKITGATLDSIKTANIERAEKGLDPIELVITAASQPVSNMESHRTFLQQAMDITNVTVHANTGEFRRILNQDEKWREEFKPDFLDANGEELIGSAVEDAKKNHPAYQAAKAQANIDISKNIATPMATNAPYNVRFITTDGGKPAHIIENDQYTTFTPNPIDPSKIINKVGAGDAFMAGFWVAQLKGLDMETSLKAGGLFATACLYQEEARLSEDVVQKLLEDKIFHPSRELEQKFLIKNDLWEFMDHSKEEHLEQGYLPQDKKKGTRLFIKFDEENGKIGTLTLINEKGSITVVGIAEVDGTKFRDVVNLSAYNPDTQELELSERTEGRSRIINGDLQHSTAIFTIKEYGEDGRTHRLEHQLEISSEDARHILNEFSEQRIRKIRTTVPFREYDWEVDEYLNEADDVMLTTVDVEVGNEDEFATLPMFPSAGKNVTDVEELRNQAIAEFGVPEEYKTNPASPEKEPEPF